MLRPLAPVVLCLALLAGCGENGGEIVEGTGYALQTPDGWVDRSDDVDELSPSGVEPDLVIADEPEGGFTTNINVLLQDELTDGMGAKRLADQSRQALRDPTVLKELGTDLSPSDLSEVRSLELDGEEARSFDYSGEQDGRELRFRQVYAVRDGTGYVTTYTAPEDDFRADVDALEHVVDSWEWE